MRILFTSGLGITAEQRIRRWQMVSQLYAALGRSLRALGHQVYFCVHPEAAHPDIPPAQTWIDAGHDHFDHLLEAFAPDFVFCWNGSSPGDRVTATLAARRGARMVFSEQGWFPQATTLYFDLAGTNARCGTRHQLHPPPEGERLERFEGARQAYAEAVGATPATPGRFAIAPPDLTKPVFVPLQDERDLNIVQDSPFTTMDAFVGFLTRTWPDLRFVVRPHPKFPSPALGGYPNVTLDDPKKPMFRSLAECGMVIGINSTTLLEAALLGHTVVSFGESLGTGTGVFRDLRPDEPMPDLRRLRIDRERALGLLARLVLDKQMLRESLGQPLRVFASPLFDELRRRVVAKPLYARL